MVLRHRVFDLAFHLLFEYFSLSFDVKRGQS
jgi:hypothetical protein